MIVHFDTEGDRMKGLNIRTTPMEGLVLHSALMQCANELSNNNIERFTAMRMCDAYLEAIKRHNEEA